MSKSPRESFIKVHCWDYPYLIIECPVSPIFNETGRFVTGLILYRTKRSALVATRHIMIALHYLNQHITDIETGTFIDPCWAFLPKPILWSIKWRLLLINGIQACNKKATTCLCSMHILDINIILSCNHTNTYSCKNRILNMILNWMWAMHLLQPKIP